MKKLFLSVLMVASAITFTSAQSAAVGTSPDASKWSIAPKGGVTYFRIKPSDGYKLDVSWGAGLIIERTVNPLWGMGLDVSYLNFNRSTIKGKTIDPTIFGSVNATNLLFPHRANAKTNVYLKGGAGVGFFNNEFYATKNASKGISPVFTAAIHPEVALGNSIALGLEVGYRYYAREILGGLVSKDRGDDALNLMATLRFNLGAGAGHVRNMTMDEFYPPIQPVVQSSQNPYDDSQLINRLDNLDRQNQDIQNRLSKLERDIKGLGNKATGESISASFNNIEFKFDSSELTEDSYPTLNQIASILKDNSTWGTLKVKGHTDSTGPDAYNQNLSERRAQSVKEYLVSQGVSDTTVSTEGYGETQPIATNDTAEGRQANRRVEFEVIK